MKSQSRDFLVSFCNNKNINTSNGTGVIGIVNFEGNKISYKDIELDLKGHDKINGATGLCKKDDYYYIILQARISKLLILNDDFSTKSIENLGSLQGVHSLCFFKNNLYMVVTKQDKIVKYIKTGEFETIYDIKTNHDTHHLNSICVHDDSLLVSGFGINNKDYWMYANNGYVINLTTNKIILNGLRQPHSLFTFENHYYLCDSSSKRIIDENQNTVIQNDIGYTRGLYITENLFIYGISKGRTRSMTNGKYIGNISDKGILEGECSINIKTNKNFKLSMKHICDEIYDIIPL